MKTQFIVPPTEFKPVTLTLTFETQQELDVFGSMFNCTIVTDSIESLGGKHPTYKEFLAAGANINLDFLEAAVNSNYIRYNYIKKS